MDSENKTRFLRVRGDRRLLNLCRFFNEEDYSSILFINDKELNKI